MKTAHKKKTLRIITTAMALLTTLSAMGLNCGTTTTASTYRDCASSGGEACIEENADQDVFCYSTSDTTLACVSVPCTPYNKTYNRHDGTCVSAGSTCVWGAWREVTTNFDHTVASTPCDPYS